MLTAKQGRQKLKQAPEGACLLNGADGQGGGQGALLQADGPRAAVRLVVDAARVAKRLPGGLVMAPQRRLGDAAVGARLRTSRTRSVYSDSR